VISKQEEALGRDGLGIAGANPNYAARVGISAVVVLIVLGGAFVLLTGTHTRPRPPLSTSPTWRMATHCSSNSTKLTHQLRSSSIIVHSLVQTLLKEDDVFRSSTGRSSRGRRRDPRDDHQQISS